MWNVTKVWINILKFYYLILFLFPAPERSRVKIVSYLKYQFFLATVINSGCIRNLSRGIRIMLTLLSSFSTWIYNFRLNLSIFLVFIPQNVRYGRTNNPWIAQTSTFFWNQSPTAEPIFYQLNYMHNFITKPVDIPKKKGINPHNIFLKGWDEPGPASPH